MAPTRGSLAVGMVAGLLWAGGMTVLAQEPEGQTVVVEAAADSEVRAALTFPTGWRLEAAPGDAARRYVNALAIDQRCEVGTRRSDFGDLRTDVDDFEAGLSPGSGFIFLARDTVALPAGPTERIDFASNEEGGRWSMYATWDTGYVHELWCRGDELPADRWLPIAETLDVEPDPALTSSAFDPTTARPDAGVALAFPQEWQVRGSSTNQGLLYATSETAVCALSDYSSLANDKGWDSVDAMHDEYVGIARDRDNLSVSEAAYLDLPAGRTGFADIGFDDGARAIRYSFGNEDGQLMALFCVGDPTPEDRYHDLARTLQWLPLGEADG